MATPILIDPHRVHELRQSGRPVRLLDVRTGSEFATAHIPGSYHVPLDLLTEHRDDIGHAICGDVVLVCRSGARATQAEAALASAPVDVPANVHVLDGGIAAWEERGLPLTRGAQVWELERQVRFAAGLIVLLSILASLVVPGAQWVAAFVGAGLVFAAVTNTCAMGMLLAALPFNRRCTPSPSDVLRQLRTPSPTPADV